MSKKRKILKVGDIVNLPLPGTPTMLVVGVEDFGDGDSEVTVVWYDDKVQSGDGFLRRVFPGGVFYAS